MDYEVTLDFGDNAVQVPHICRSLSELGLYLERVPSMIGFELNCEVRVKIKRIPVKQQHTNSERRFIHEPC